ncbi:MAG: GntR family transcriptional regulator [Actinomycetota bacterium]
MHGNVVLEVLGHGTTGNRIASALRDAILDGEYQPGERIRQDDVAERFGASRLPVREALRILNAEGLVTLVANTGAWVSYLSLAECEELYQMRERLEPLLLRMSIPLLSSSVVDRLEELAAAMETAHSIDEFLRLDQEFHLSTVSAPPTSMLGDTVRGLWNRTHHYRRAVTGLLYEDGDRSVHHDHHLIGSAIRRSDLDEAEHLLGLHIRRTRLQLAKHPEIFSRGAAD